MKRLLATTALISAIAVLPAYAQTATDTTTAPADATAPANPAAITPPAGYEAYETMALTGQELQGATVYDVNGDSIGDVSDFVFDMSGAATGTTAMEPTDSATGTDATATTGTEAAATDSTATTETDTAASDTAATTETDTAATATGGENLAEYPTHVVLDIGGFLGMGVHTVAVPTSELQVFRGESNDLRIYLPWTKEQMEALPEYEEGNPATYGAAATN